LTPWLRIIRLWPMTTQPEDTAKSLTELVATEIRVAMARADMRQAQLARAIGKTEQWLSVRLRGRQPITVNDLDLIAEALGVNVIDLIPSASHEPEATDAPPPPVAAHRPKPTSPRPPSRPKPNKVPSLVS